ncbi:hypothetical protein HID58_079890, partial [Brassica napus]
MEDFRELEEFLKLEDGERLEDWDINKEITMEDFLELENFLKVLDEAQLEDWDINKEISMEDFLELEDFLKVLDEAQTEDLESSHLAIPEHLRPPICAEEVVGFHKRVKRMHEPVKIVVACAVFEVEFPIPPDRSVHMGSYN